MLQRAKMLIIIIPISWDPVKFSMVSYMMSVFQVEAIFWLQRFCQHVLAQIVELDAS